MKFEVRDDGSAVISGYVNAVGRESRVLHDVSGDFVEIVQPGCFQRALDKTETVGLMFNHERSVDAESLSLREDAIGLYAETVIKDAEIIDHAKAGELRGWSFGFYPEKDEWKTNEDGMRVRTLEDIDLIEVSILTKTPAYIATSIEMRGDDELMKEFRMAEGEVEVVQPPVVEKVEEQVDPEPSIDMTHLRREFEFMKLKGMK